MKSNATTAQMKSGFNWACEYGRTSVVDFLLRRGIDAGERHHGGTGLHWAAYGGHRDIAKLLLKQKAPVPPEDERFGGTPLGWALYGWQEGVPCGAPCHYDEVVKASRSTPGIADAEWLANEKIRADPRMRAALGGRVSAMKVVQEEAPSSCALRPTPSWQSPSSTKQEGVCIPSSNPWLGNWGGPCHELFKSLLAKAILGHQGLPDHPGRSRVLPALLDLVNDVLKVPGRTRKLGQLEPTGQPDLVLVGGQKPDQTLFGYPPGQHARGRQGLGEAWLVIAHRFKLKLWLSS